MAASLTMSVAFVVLLFSGALAHSGGKGADSGPFGKDGRLFKPHYQDVNGDDELGLEDFYGSGRDGAHAFKNDNRFLNDVFSGPDEKPFVYDHDYYELFGSPEQYHYQDTNGNGDYDIYDFYDDGYAYTNDARQLNEFYYGGYGDDDEYDFYDW